jgi:hypothetical protein
VFFALHWSSFFHICPALLWWEIPGRIIRQL